MDPLVQAITIFHLDTCKCLTLLFVFTVRHEPLFTTVYRPWKIKIMAPGPITSWQIDGETMGTVTDFIFLDSKITADGDCSHDVKRCLFLGRKSMINLDSILKSGDITLPTQVHRVKAIVFSSGHIQMWELDGKKGCVPSNWCFQTGEDSWESFGLPGDQTSQS